MIKSISSFKVAFVLGFFSTYSWASQLENSSTSVPPATPSVLSQSTSVSPATPPVSNEGKSKARGNFQKFVAKGAAKGAGVGAGVGVGVYHGTKEGLRQFKDVPAHVIKRRRDAVQDNRKALAGVPVDTAKIAVGAPGSAVVGGLVEGVKKGKETSKRVSRKVENRLLGNKTPASQ